MILVLILSVIPVALAFFVYRAMEPRRLPPPPDEIHSAVKVRVYDRFGRCQAHHCDAVYLDTTRNGSRRYCSSACTARAKTAAYRGRRAG